MRVPPRALTVVDAALVVTLAVSLLAWFLDPLRLNLGPAHLTVGWGLKPALAPILLLVLRIVLARRAETPTPSILPRIALAMATVLAPLALIEGALAAFGVQPGEPVFVSRDEAGRSLRADGAMVSDPRLLWRFQPGTTFYGRRVNALGFLDRDTVTEKKPAGIHRVICLGDSCSAQGMPPYSGYLHKLLQEDSPSWEAFNAAVHGYTIVQGLAEFRTRVCHWSPDVVTIYFGWNDHWLAAEQDADRIARAGPAWVTALRNAIVRKRIHTVFARKAADGGQPAMRVRVSTGLYAECLRTLIREIRACGAEPLVLTAPRAETLYRGLVHAGHAESVHEAIRLHDEYADLTREVAREENARLLDLEETFADADSRKLMSADGIHFKQAGLERIAELIHAELLKTDPAAFRPGAGTR